MPRGDAVCVDLRRIPLGTSLYFFVGYTIATLVVAYLGFLFASTVLLTGTRDAQILGVASAVAAWAAVWTVAWRSEAPGVPQGDPARQPGERERVAAGRVATVAAALGIEPPRIVVTPTYGGPSVRVCGLAKPYTLVIQRIDAKSALTYPDRFDAAVAHELAHVAGGDARRLALFRALAAVLSVLLLCALGVPCARFALQTARDAPDAMLAAAVPTEWLAWRALRFATEFLAPAAVTVLAFRLGYTRLIRRQELLADWRAAASGHGRALRDIAAEEAAVRPASPWLSWLQVHPTPAHRAWVLSDPARLNRTSAADYALLGAVLIVAWTWLTDSGVRGLAGVEEPSWHTLSEASQALMNMKLAALMVMLAWFALSSTIILVIPLFFARDLAAVTANKTSVAVASIRAATWMTVGIIIGGALWIGNVIEPNFFYLSNGYNLSDAVGLTGAGLVENAATWVCFATAFCGAGLVLRWRLHRCGAGPSPRALAVDAILLLWTTLNFAFAFRLLLPGLVALVQQAGSSLTADADATASTPAAMDLLAVAIAPSAIIAIPVALALARGRGTVPALDGIRPPPWDRSVAHHLERGRAHFSLRDCAPVLLRVAVLLALCGAVSLELDRRVLVIEPVGGEGRRPPTDEEVEGLRESLVRRMHTARSNWIEPKVVGLRAEGRAGSLAEGYERLAAGVEWRSPARRFVVKLRGPTLDGGDQSTTVAGDLRRSLLVSLGLEALPDGMMERLAGTVLEATFPYLEMLARLEEEPSGESAIKVGLYAVQRWPPGDANAVDASVLLGILYEARDVAKAQKYYRNAASARPDAAIAWANLGRLNMAEGKFDEAIQLHRRAVRLSPWHGEPHFELAIALHLRSLRDPDPTSAAVLAREACRRLAISRRLKFDEKEAVFGRGRENHNPALSCDAPPA